MEEQDKKFVGYFRVSTQKQGINGLGMDAQRASVASFISQSNGKLVAEFAEVETGKRKDRPELEKAIAFCRRQKAVLVIAKLDRLARNAFFVLGLRDSGVDFVALDAPYANKLTIGILALVAEDEAERISQRTKAGLAAARRHGIKLGNPKLDKVRAKAVAANVARATAFADRLAPVIKQIQKAGVETQEGVAECLNARGIKTRAAKPFTRQAVARIFTYLQMPT